MKIGKDYIGVGVGAFIINDNNELLLQKRAVPAEKDHWCIPGGRLEMFETLEHAVIRETKEEVGLDIISVETNHEESSLSAEKMKEMIETMKSEQITAILVDSQDDLKSAQTLANETGAKIYELQTGLIGDTADESYLQAMKSNLDVLKQIL